MKYLVVNLRHIKARLTQFLHRLKRTPRLLFHSPEIALAKARQPINHGINLDHAAIQKIANDLTDKVSIHRNVLSWPLREGENGRFAGGLTHGGIHDLLVEAVHYRHGAPFQEPPDPYTWGVRHLDAPELAHTLLFGGILYNHFGHFLLEGLGRLWAYDFVKEFDPYICFYAPWGIPDYLTRGNFVNQVLTGFGIPHERLVFINHLVKLNTVIVPRQMYGFGYERQPDPVFLDFMRKFRLSIDIPLGYEMADKIYVSRSRLPISQGGLIGEIHFEEYLTSNGYKVFYPERHTLFQQLTVYSRANKLIFSSGSALHGCLLLPDLRADVAVYSRSNGIGLCHMEQFYGYGKPVTGIDAVRMEYSFGRDYWDSLADIDYHTVSFSLKEAGFVDSLFEGFSQIDHKKLVRHVLQNYLQAISRDPGFIDFMMRLDRQTTKSIDA